MHVIKQDQVQEKIITLRDQRIIIDTDVAELYGVKTKRINEAVSRNQDKFPNGYLFELSKEEWELLKSQFATSMAPIHQGLIQFSFRTLRIISKKRARLIKSIFFKQ